MSAPARAQLAGSAWVAILSLLAMPARAERRNDEAPTQVSTATKTSLVWILGDDDVFSPPDQTVPPSPATSIGDRAGYDALFEGSSSRYTGRENRLELRLAGEATGLHELFSTRAELALGVDMAGLGERAGTLGFEDAGSWLELFARFSRDPERAADGAGARLHPLDGDRERLGELEALGVGGVVGPLRESPYARARGPVRAGRLVLELLGVRGFLVLKTATFAEPQPVGPAVDETSYALFGGIESTWRRLLQFGLGFGYFEHGRLPAATLPAPRATTTAGSARVSLARGLTKPRAPASFGSEPPPFDPAREAPERTNGIAFGVEGSHIVQRLVVFEHPETTALTGARALSVLGTLRQAWFELRLALIARDAGFVMRNVPGVFPGQTTPKSAHELPELAALTSVGFQPFDALGLTLALGVRRPAAVLVQAQDRLGQATGATLVLRGPSDGELLPPGEGPLPVIDLRPEGELRVSKLLELMAWFGYRRDFNRTRLVPSGDNLFTRAFSDPDRLSFGLAARSVW
jgi:hypothetical protein